MAANPVERLYSQKAKLYQFFFIGLLKWGKVLANYFQENDYLHPGMKILDAGCGAGSVTRVLYDLARQQGYDELTFHGFDLSPAMLDLFRRWRDEENAQDIRLQQANVLDLGTQLPNDWVDFDLIVSSAMVEYIPKDKLVQALGQLRRLLHKDGRLLILVTRQTPVARWLGAKWWKTNLFDREELGIELRRAGFTAIQDKKLPASWDSFMMAVEAGVNWEDRSNRPQ